MRIIICDDDIELTQELKKILVSFFQKNSLKLPEISIYNNGQDLLNDTGDKDIVFLDIEMPGMNGIYIGNELKQKNKNTIIFVVTSYSQYLDEAMRFNVFRYLSKPLDKQRIFRNLQDAITLYNTSITKVSIETKDGMFIVLSTDIFFIEAHNHKTIVHTSEGNYLSVHNINYWLNELYIPCFFQSHRSFIVNLDHVSSFDRSLIYLCNNQYRAYLTRRKYTQFKDAFLLYLESRR